MKPYTRTPKTSSSRAIWKVEASLSYEINIDRKAEPGFGVSAIVFSGWGAGAVSVDAAAEWAGGEHFDGEAIDPVGLRSGNMEFLSYLISVVCEKEMDSSTAEVIA